SHVLKLADQFQMKDALAQSGLFLLRSSRIQTIDKLMMADKYDLKGFMVNYLSAFSCAFQMRLRKSDLAKLSDKMKHAINDRMRQLLFDDYEDRYHRCYCGANYADSSDEDESMDSYIEEEDNSDIDVVD
ncbi:hypothetical protein PMAYCL1PPCAC_25681, partial [Pristionchus mayeri]